MLEALAIVVANTFTNYVNALVKTDVNFPAAPSIDRLGPEYRRIYLRRARE